MSYVEITKDVATLFATVVASYVAIDGLSAWKKQMKGKTEYDLARRYLRCVLRVRDAIKTVRNPFISTEEMSTALKENGVEGENLTDHQKTNRAVYSRRWKTVTEASSDLRVEMLEAEVLWGKQAVRIYDDMEACVNKLFTGVYVFLNGDVKKYSDTEIIYDLRDKDLLNKEIDAAILKIEDYLKPHLK